MGSPIAIYVHLPWCVRKCPYCDFNSHARPESLPEQEYVAALLSDLEGDLDLAPAREVSTLFLGGGTPSLFSVAAVASLLEGLAARLRFAPGAEITMEANPGTVEHGRFAGYAAAGVNRVSLGAQSFDPAALSALGRIHGPGEIEAAVAELAAAGLDNFNLDLMYGLPGQSVAGALSDVDTALALSPAHLSHYQLTLEPGTVFYHRPPPLPDSDAIWRMQLDCQERLAARGYEHYEVSAYARAGRRSRHNLNYWQFGDYIGVGAGAHGKLTWLATAERRRPAIVRSARIKQPREFLRRAAAERISDRFPVESGELPFEYMLNVLRLTDDFAEADYEARTGLVFATVADAVAEAERKGLLRRAGDGRWRVTDLGQRFLNDLQALFLPVGQLSRRASGATSLA